MSTRPSSLSSSLLALDLTWPRVVPLMFRVLQPRTAHRVSKSCFRKYAWCWFIWRLNILDSVRGGKSQGTRNSVVGQANGHLPSSFRHKGIWPFYNTASNQRQRLREAIAHHRVWTVSCVWADLHLQKSFSAPYIAVFRIYGRLEMVLQVLGGWIRGKGIVMLPSLSIQRWSWCRMTRLWR